MGKQGEKNAEIAKYNNKMNSVIFKGFSDRDFNLFVSIIARVSGKGTQKEIKLDYATLKRLAGFENKHITNDKFNEMLKEMNQKLLHCTCSLKLGAKEVDFALFPTFIRDKEKGILTVKVSELLGYIVNDFEGYTSLELKRFVRIESKYTKTLYRKLRQFKSTGEYAVSIEKFREEFLIPKTYKQSDIQKRVIIPAIEELKDEFKGLECIPHYAPRQGAPVDRYTFKFQPSDQIPGQMTATEYLDSLDYANKPKASKNQFNNFEQREYTSGYFEELEKTLLDN